MSDLDENIADLNAAGMTMGVLQPTQTMFFYWTEPSATSELSRMVNELMAKEVERRPDQIGEEAEPRPAGIKNRGKHPRNDFLLHSSVGWLIKTGSFSSD